MSGSSSETVLIYTAAELSVFRDRVNNGETELNAKLMADIDLSHVEYWRPIGGRLKETAGREGTFWDGVPGNFLIQDTWDNGFDWAGATYYNGTFDGNGHTVSNANILASPEESLSVGFFGILSGATVKDLTLANCTITFTGGHVLRTGAITGNCLDSRIENCHVTLDLTSDDKSRSYHFGGIAGSVEDSAQISGCSVEFLCLDSDEGVSTYAELRESPIYGQFWGAEYVVRCKYKYAGGSWTSPDDLYNNIVQISSYANLLDFARRVNSGETKLNAVLTADIDIPAGKTWTPIGYLKGDISDPAAWLENGSLDWENEFTDAHKFSIEWPGVHYEGCFNGQGHTISGLNIETNPNESVSAGFFACLGMHGDVRHLNIKGKLTIDGYMLRAGAVVGYLYTGVVTGCTAEFEIEVRDGAKLEVFGGIAGTVEYGSSVVNCDATLLNYSALSSLVPARDPIAGVLQNGTNAVSNCRYRESTSDSWTTRPDMTTED